MNLYSMYLYRVASLWGCASLAWPDLFLAQEFIWLISAPDKTAFTLQAITPCKNNGLAKRDYRAVHVSLKIT